MMPNSFILHSNDDATARHVQGNLTLLAQDAIVEYFPHSVATLEMTRQIDDLRRTSLWFVRDDMNGNSSKKIACGDCMRDVPGFEDHPDLCRARSFNLDIQRFLP